MSHSTTPPAEILSAASDAMLIQLGISPDRPHPLAKGLAVEQIAYAMGLKLMGASSSDDRAVMASGFGSVDFSALFADGVRGVAFSAYDKASEDYRRFCGTSNLPDYKGGSIIDFSMDFDLQELAENGEILTGTKFGIGAGSDVTLKRYGRLAFIARSLVVGDRFDVIQQIFTGVGASVSQKEVRILAAILNSNPDMADGQPVFAAGNTVAQAMDATSIASAMALLRSQKGEAGNDLNLTTRHLVVSPELEYAACKLKTDAGLSQIEVTAVCGLDAGRWFVTADPAMYPAVSLLRLGRKKIAPMEVSAKWKMTSDGIDIKVAADLGAAYLRRTGIVRGGV